MVVYCCSLTVRARSPDHLCQPVFSNPQLLLMFDSINLQVHVSPESLPSLSIKINDV